MAASLGSLVVSLGLDSAEFTRGLTKSEYEAQKALGRIKQEASDMGRIVGMVAVAAGAAVLAMGVKFIGAAADLDDMAEKTGASVEGLSKLAQQARISGTDIGTVETGLVRLSKSLNASDEESKKAAKAFEFLGLKAENLAKLDTADALKIVAAEMNKFADGSGKTALALDLFGKSGAELLPFLKDMANDGEIAANVTAKQAAEAEELGKAWRRLTNDARNVGQAIALDIVPWMKDLIEQFTKGIQIAGSFGTALRLFGLSTITSANALDKIGEFVKRRDELNAQIAAGPRARGGVDLSAARAELVDIQKKIEFATLLATQRGERDNFDASINKSLQRASYRGSATPAAAKKAIDEELKDRRAQIDMSRRMQEADVRATQYYRDEIKKIEDDAAKDRDDQIAQQVRLQQMDLDAQRYFAKEIESLAKSTDKATDSGKAFGQHMSSALEDLIFKGEKSISVMRALEAAALDVAKAIFREQVTNPLAKAGAGIFDSILKGVFGGGGGTAPAPAPAPHYGEAATGIDRVPRDGFAFLHQGETVVPEFHSRGGSVVINVTQDNRGVDPAVIGRIEQANAQLRREIVPLVRDANRRTV